MGKRRNFDAKMWKHSSFQLTKVRTLLQKKEENDTITVFPLMNQLEIKAKRMMKEIFRKYSRLITKLTRNE